MSLPAMWDSKLVLAAHHIDPMRRIRADARKTGRRPIAMAIGIAIKLPMPINRVG